MLTVHLHKLVFHGFHGLYEGENLVGNDFEVSLDVSYEVRNEEMDNLNNLISYEDLFKVVESRMSVPTPLLEELAVSIMRKIRHKFPLVESIRISIYKLNAPIEKIQGKVGISIFKNYTDKLKNDKRRK